MTEFTVTAERCTLWKNIVLNLILLATTILRIQAAALAAWCAVSYALTTLLRVGHTIFALSKQLSKATSITVKCTTLEANNTNEFN